MDRGLSLAPAPSPDGVDLGYRPRGYFWADTLGLKLASSIQGADRRQYLLQALADSGPVPKLLTEETLTADQRDRWGRLHPQHLGGEFLPPPRRGEVEIARISIDSTTQDVTCVYARQGLSRIRYRVVDEYGGLTLRGRARRTSHRPLTLQSLIAFFLGAWKLETVLGMNFAPCDAQAAPAQRFLREVSSDFYPDFEAAVRQRVLHWAAVRPRPD